ncbi:MAG: choice-of-anchor D domain-containing protein, partial [Bacteroidota bacterium]
LAVGETGSIALEFEPDEAGSFLDSFYVLVPVPSGLDTVEFYVAGTAEVPVLTLTVATDAGELAENDIIDFGEVILTEDSTQVVTITNPSVLDIDLTAVQLDDLTHFSVDDSGLATTLAAGASTSFSVTYAPTVEGEHTSDLTIESSADDTSFALQLRGSSIVSSVNEFGIEAVQAFPNPVRNVFTLQLVEGLEKANFRIFDLNGKTVRNGEWPSGAPQHQFDLSDLPTGSYQLELLAEQGRLLVEIVKQ